MAEAGIIIGLVLTILWRVRQTQKAIDSISEIYSQSAKTLDDKPKRKNDELIDWPPIE